MITSSSKCIIKSHDRKREAEYGLFMPPVQTEIRPPVKREPAKAAQELTLPEEEAACEPERKRLHEADEIVSIAREEARQIQRNAKEAAKKLLDSAKEEAERMKLDAVEEGCREGYRQGVRDGTEKAREEHRKTLERELVGFQADMKNALDAVTAAKEECVRVYVDELRDCAIAIAEKVVRISLKSSGEIIKRMIVSATEKLKKTAWVKIYMDKVSYEMIMEGDSHVIDELSKLSDNIKFIVMNKETGGNCIIEMPEEIVDISVDTQLGNIREILENTRL